MRGHIALFLVSVALQTPAAAGAWTLPPGRSLAILKLETGAALGAAPSQIDQQFLNLFMERGLTGNLSVELETGVKRNTYAGTQRTGLGEQAIGLKYHVGRWRDVIVSGYVGERVLVDLGVGPFAKDRPDWRTEARGMVGANYRFLGHDGYVDLEGKILYAGGARLQIREDSTLGVNVGRDTSLSFSLRRGEDLREARRSAWTALEVTTVRKYGRWRIEAGWKRTVTSPRLTTISGPVFAVWSSF